MLEDQLERLINQGVKKKLFPACVIGAITPSQEVVVCGGTFTYEDQRPIKPDSVFDAASLTKVIPTSSMALKLIEENRLKLEDPISRYLPGYSHKVTVWNLLTQTVYYEFGFPLSSLAHKPAAEILDIIFKTPVKVSRNEHHYTNASSILLGLVVEKLYGQDLAAAAAEVFFGPLGMNRSGFDPLSFAKREEIVPTEIGSDGKAVHGIVHDESTRAFSPRPVGSAGLFTTAPDLLKFMRALLSDDQSLFSKETVKMISRNQLTGDACTGLGWELNQPHFMGRFAAGSFGKTGFTGCLFLCNPDLQAGIVILSNHIYPMRPDSFGPINRFRRAAADLVFGSAAA